MRPPKNRGVLFLNLTHYANIRSSEIEQVLPLIPTGSCILEIGAGSGQQARMLSENGFETTAIDIEQKEHTAKVWPVEYYDGKHVPFPNDSFDVVFSSNVLEHIPHVQQFQSELLRVLKKDGIAIHLLPTGTWRIHTLLTHYPYAAKRLVGVLLGTDSIRTEKNRSGDLVKKNVLQIIKQVLVPPRHGER